MFLAPLPAAVVVREAQPAHVCEIEFRNVDFFLQRVDGSGQQIFDGSFKDRRDGGLDEHGLFDVVAFFLFAFMLVDVVMMQAGSLVGTFDVVV